MTCGEEQRGKKEEKKRKERKRERENGHKGGGRELGRGQLVQGLITLCCLLKCLRLGLMIDEMCAWLLETFSFWSSWLLSFLWFKGQLQLHVLDPSQFGGHLDPLTSFLDCLIQLWPKSQNTLTQGTQVTTPCCVKQNGGAMKRMRTQSIPSFLRVVFFGTQLMWSSSRVTTHNLPETRKVSLKVKSVLDARWNEGIRLSPWLSPVGLRSRTVVLLSNTPWIPEVSVANDWLLLTSSVGTVESLTSSVGTVESLTSRVGTVESLTSRVGTVESQASSVGIVPFNRSPSSKVSKRGFDFT